MTLLVSWPGIQTKGKGNNVICSIYIATDSRYSWSNTKDFFDLGKKIFSCYNSPDAFALCGTVMFPALVLSSLVTLIDRGVFFIDDESKESKVAKVKNYLDNAIRNYNKKEIGSFEILHVFRIEGEFCLSHYVYDKKLKYEEVDLLQGNHYFATGSGKDVFMTNFLDNNKNDNYLTSRYIFHCFIHTINSNQIADVGGKPQIVALYGRGNTIDIGYLEDNHCYIYGNECNDDINLQKVSEWRNENFERCDPKTKQMLKGAQRQPFRNWK